MKTWIAFWTIMRKDVRAYYLKPPNVSWGLLFPLAWTGMFFIRSGAGIDDARTLLPGVITLSVLFGATSLLAVTVTFEKKGRSFERLLLAPIPIELLMLAKTMGAILFGIANGFVPILLAAFLTGLSGIDWLALVTAIALVAVTSTFMGLFIAVSVSEVFEAQTFSNFFRFPMLFLCGLFFPIESLPAMLRPLAYALPPTYGADALRTSIMGAGLMPLWLDFTALALFALALFGLSLLNIRRKWIA